MLKAKSGDLGNVNGKSKGLLDVVEMALKKEFTSGFGVSDGAGQLTVTCPPSSHKGLVVYLDKREVCAYVPGMLVFAQAAADALLAHKGERYEIFTEYHGEKRVEYSTVRKG